MVIYFRSLSIALGPIVLALWQTPAVRMVNEFLDEDDNGHNLSTQGQERQRTCSFDCSEVTSGKACGYGVQATWLLVQTLCRTSGNLMGFVELDDRCGDQCKAIESALRSPSQGQTGFLKPDKGPSQLLAWLFDKDGMRSYGPFERISFFLESNYYGEVDGLEIAHNMSELVVENQSVLEDEDNEWDIVDIFPLVTNEEMLAAMAYLKVLGVPRNDASEPMLRFFWVHSANAKQLQSAIERFEQFKEEQKTPVPKDQIAAFEQQIAKFRANAIAEYPRYDQLLAHVEQLISEEEDAAFLYRHVQNVVRALSSG